MTHANRSRRLLLTLVLALGTGFMAVAWAATPLMAQDGTQAPRKGASTGLDLPRFVSLKAGKVNVRRGPGVQFPIDWVFVRPNLPVEIIEEWEHWRQIRDHDGATGWIHQQLVQGTRTALVVGGVQTLRKDASATAEAVARAEPNVIVTLDRCELGWCRVEVESATGWLPKTALWGVYPGEVFD